LLVNGWSSGSASGEPALVSFLVDAFLFLVAFRVLMVWAYERTNGSLLLAMLMHASYSASTFILNPLAGPGAMSGSSLLTYDLVLAAALWIVVGVVALANGGHVSRQLLSSKRVA
jgi:prolipoprotein diacylglyceryltransferase